MGLHTRAAREVGRCLTVLKARRACSFADAPVFACWTHPQAVFKMLLKKIYKRQK